MKDQFLSMKNGFLEPPRRLPTPNNLGKRPENPENQKKTEILGRRHQAEGLFNRDEGNGDGAHGTNAETPVANVQQPRNSADLSACEKGFRVEVFASISVHFESCRIRGAAPLLPPQPRGALGEEVCGGVLGIHSSGPGILWNCIQFHGIR